MKRATQIMCVAVVVGVGSAAMAVDIETVPVGNPGNAGEQSRLAHSDTTYYGGVDYKYNIGKYEVTAGQYTEFLNAVAKTDTYWLYSQLMDSDSRGCQITRSGSSDSYSYSVAGDWANRPVNYISWGDAARFANWLHNGQPGLDTRVAQDANSTEDGSYFLDGAMSDADLLAVVRYAHGATWVIPTEDEWYKAAYYDGGASSYYDYPTSSNSEPGRDMTENTNPGNNANINENGPDPIDSPYYTTVVGEFEKSHSPYDTFDQGGNVREWNEVTMIGLYRGLRGGSFSSHADMLLVSARGSFYPPTGEYQNFGFRVAEVPEPATLSLLALGSLALVRRRKRGMCK